MATITLEVSKTGTVEYFMEDEDYEALINYYGGDVKKFTKELDIDDSYINYYEYDINDIEYKGEEIKQGIEEFANKKGIVYDDDYNINKLLSYNPLLSNYLVEIPEALTPLNIDKNLALKVYRFADINNPKIELDYVRIYGDKMIATDTKILIVAKHDILYPIEIFIPACFLWTLDKGGELFMDENAKACLKYNRLFYSTKFKKLNKYPDIDRILPKEFNFMKFENIESVEKIGEAVIKLPNGAFISQENYDLLTTFEFEEYSQIETNLPIYFKNKEVEILVMPLVF
ncbi:MAG: hypothetical protein ACWGHH_06640 [Sulfurovaceae bacterium]